MRRRWLVSLVVLACLALPTKVWAEAETLEQAWAEAYRANPTLQAERAKLRALDEQVSLALSNWRPSVDITSSVGRSYERSPQSEDFIKNTIANATRSYGVEFTQPLFRGFRTVLETEAAEKQVMAGRAGLQSAEQQLFLDTATAFLDLVRDQEVLDINRDNENVLKKKLEETEKH